MSKRRKRNNNRQHQPQSTAKRPEAAAELLEPAALETEQPEEAAVVSATAAREEIIAEPLLKEDYALDEPLEAVEEPLREEDDALREPVGQFETERLIDVDGIEPLELEEEPEEDTRYAHPAKTASKKEKKRSKRSVPEDNAELSVFLREGLIRCRDWVKGHWQACLIAAAAVVFCIAVILIAGAVSRRSAEGSPEDAASVEQTSIVAVTEAPLEEDADPEVTALIHRYFTARAENDMDTLREILSHMDDTKVLQMQAINSYIAGFDNIRCYTKQGPFTDSYIVYATYDCTFRDWEDCPAPALLALLVCTDPEGGLYIESGEIDQNAAAILKTVSSQQDVVDLFNRVNTEYQEVIDANAEFAAYMAELHPSIQRDVNELVAAARDGAGAESQGAEETTETGEEEQAPVEETAEPETPAEEPFMVEATTAVNVRQSDSENADRIGQVAAGTQLSCLEQRANGWSRIVYEGEEGYIKSDYLRRLDGGDSTEELTTNGRITVTSTVNIRATADVNGERLGMAYAGESFDLIERGAEWTRVLYNGQSAYIKSDYVSN